ncbi:hypothetical protein GCM10025857_19170 [Alicyclobacillus contaminans]|nr:hypothetical protein GCM10025857_19170 [Alicyclobacillus contaminans]
MVYTIPGVDLLNAVAANRLLKTLEEPNPSVVALLTATQPQNVLPTILSRCFIYSVQPRGTHAVWDDLLPEIPAKEETLSAEESFAAASKAVVQWAQTLLQGREGPVLLADSLLEAAAEMGVDVFLRLLAMYLRDVAHVQAGDREHVAVSDWQADLTRHARTVPMDRLYRAIPIVLEARVRLRSHVAPALNLERMCIRLREVLHGV